ncbi:MAG TPA: NAD-dependent epimerase/dehydratase family protein [Pirellula sp.]|nr:NAD-dependent epimerase/dehydratase family protein [Pirellula sp.]
MRVLITGANGLLGNNIARLAQNRGMEIASLSRSDQNNRAFEGLNIEVFPTELRDRLSVSRVFETHFDVVIHCAAHIHIGWKFMDKGMQVNREGTRYLLDEAGRRDIKFIHVSTVNTLAVGAKDTISDEETDGDGQIPCTYVVTKKAAEKLAVEAASTGQDVVIVHPGFMLGPWDWKPSSGRMIQALQGFAPLAPSGGCTVCDPRDVAEAILNSIERGVPGRHYILGGENMTYLELWRRICAVLGKRGPFTSMRAPGRLIANAIGDTISRFMTNELDINSAAIGMASQFHWYSSRRAITDLGYKPRSASESIQDAVNWLRQNNLLKALPNEH